MKNLTLDKVFVLYVFSVDEMKSMLSKSNWDHQKTDISIHGPLTLDVHSNFKMKDGEVFLKSRKNVLTKISNKV